MFIENSAKPLYEVFKRQKKVADVGIEIEVEGVGLPGAVSHWQAKTEGSLQEGMEYITKPIKADVVKQYVDHLNTTILQTGHIKETYRTSTHVHLNMLPENVEDVLGFYVVFTMFEPLLLSLCGGQRNGNLFCMSSYDTGDLVTAFEGMCQAFHAIETHGFYYSDRGKYSSLNSGRLTDLGTLEVRCFPMSLNGNTVSQWVNWLLTMRDIVRAEQDKTFRTLWKNVRQNPSWYAIKIFGFQAHIPNATSLVDFGSETAYELTKVLKKWRNKTEKPAEKKSPRRKGFTDITLEQMQQFAPVGIGSTISGWAPAPPAPVVPDSTEF